jgi:Zn ribbon nucleic-acid-binding protein
MSDEYEHHVWQSAACPTCNENHMDELVWSENGDYVECQSCGTKYRPQNNRELVEEAA